MCRQPPTRPTSDSPDREAERTTASHPEQGCNHQPNPSP
ncbi:DUF5999 family protein [Streptomyces chartreusis]